MDLVIRTSSLSTKNSFAGQVTESALHERAPPPRDALLPRALSSFLIASLLVSLLAIFMEWLVRGRFGVV